jgi:hypothetical protein
LPRHLLKENFSHSSPLSEAKISLSPSRLLAIIENKGDTLLLWNWHPTCNYAKQSIRPPGPTKEGNNTMAVISIFTCVCGVQKKTSNHWVLAKATPFGIAFMPWDENIARSTDVDVLCGEGCAAALLSRSLGEWKQSTPAAAVTEQEFAAA